MKKLNKGISFDNDKICILLYADDIVILTAQLQLLLNFTDGWCENQKMKISRDKTKVVHYRKNSTPRSNQSFLMGDFDIEIVDKYKYRGIFLNEFLDF